MEPLFTYLWQSAIVLTVLYIPFQLLLRKEQYFALNRAILMAILLLSVVLPLSRHTMPEWIVSWLGLAAEQKVATVFELEEAQVAYDMTDLQQDSYFDLSSWFEQHWRHLLTVIWLLGSAIFLLWQMKGLWRLCQMMHDPENVREQLADGSTLLLLTASVPSFSWMHTIVISGDDYAENGNTILTHERAHIVHHHSFDRMLLLVVQTLQWWNPFVWFLSDALTQVHEYQADLAVLHQGINATQYQLLLIRKAAGPAGLVLVNGFKRNKLKLRIVMMNKMIELRGAKSRYLALLPMVLIAFACTATPSSNVENTKGDDVKLTILVNREGKCLFADGETDKFVPKEQLSAELAKMQLSQEDVIDIVGDPETPMSIITELKNVLQENNVAKIVYRMEGDKEIIEQKVLLTSEQKPDTESDDDVFNVCDNNPEFPGGDMELMKFIQNNMRYPAECVEENIEGRVILSFIVEKDGSISSIEELKSPHPLLTAEARRVVEAMPKWKAGKQNGSVVRSKYVLPFTFRLN